MKAELEAVVLTMCKGAASLLSQSKQACVTSTALLKLSVCLVTEEKSN